MSDRKLEMGNSQARNVNDQETQEVLQMDKCQQRTFENLLPEDSFTSFILPDLDLTRKSSRSPRPDTASNLVKEQGLKDAQCSLIIGHLGTPFVM